VNFFFKAFCTVHSFNIWNKNQLMSLFQFYLYIVGSLHVSGPPAHPQESSHSCSHNHWFGVCTALTVCSVCCGRSWWLGDTNSENENPGVIYLHVSWRFISSGRSCCIQQSVGNKRLDLGFTSLPYNVHLISFLGVKWRLCGIGHSASFCIEVKKE